MRISLCLVSLALAPALVPALAAQKLQVYVLAGQSNMEGHAQVTTFDYIGDDPLTAPLLKEMRNADGTPRVCDDVWITYLTGSRNGDGEGFGKLTAGYGARRNPAEDGGKIGPEFTFGIHVGKAAKGPVLLIKTAWGGKSLHTDFRPPSAGPYPFSSKQLEQMAKRNKDVEQAKQDRAAATGHYYRAMIGHVRRVLGDIRRVCPAYDPAKGYELAGFVWFQGWNDLVDQGTYPDRDKPGGYEAYSQCMACFIRDVRKDLGAPGMPFVIGVLGVNGPIEAVSPRYRAVYDNFRKAMAAPAALPEFAGNVAAVQTWPFWDLRLAGIEEKIGKVNQMGRMLKNRHKDHANADGKMTPKQQRAYLDKYRAEVLGDDEAVWKRGASNGGYHYLGSAKTMALIGKAFAEAALSMRK